jgi:clan AA aspartic protease
MGLIRAEIELANARQDELEPMTVLALVDTGALHLCLPEHVARQLRLPELDRREVTLADGTRLVVPYAGPVRVRFRNRQCLVGALIVGDEPLLGAIPMEDMDVQISPSRQALVVNPDSPNIPTSVAKALTSAGTTAETQRVRHSRTELERGVPNNEGLRLEAAE